MWRYLKAAFLVSIPIAGLGQLPINAMAAFAIAAFGFVEPSVWLAGFGLEAALVGSLAFNARFQKLVDARALPLVIQAETAKRSMLIASLPQDLQGRLGALHNNAARILTISRKLGAEPELLSATESSLDKLQWIYLKLLIARDHLANDLGAESAPSLRQRIHDLELEATSERGANMALQRSQQATLNLLRQRLNNLENRDQLLKENQSDLSRIEAQVALMRENAAIEGKPSAVDTEIELATDLRASGLFGMQAPLIHALESELEQGRPR
jgi:hypothetical protein